MIIPLPLAEAEVRHQALDQWTLSAERGGCLQKTFRFADFASAFQFMTEMADISERLNHHPEWLNVYNRVEVTLTTHDAGGLSNLDFDWALAADRAAGPTS